MYFSKAKQLSWLVFLKPGSRPARDMQPTCTRTVPCATGPWRVGGGRGAGRAGAAGGRGGRGGECWAAGVHVGASGQKPQPSALACPPGAAVAAATAAAAAAAHLGHCRHRVVSRVGCAIDLLQRAVVLRLELVRHSFLRSKAGGGAGGYQQLLRQQQLTPTGCCPGAQRFAARPSSPVQSRISSTSSSSSLGDQAGRGLTSLVT
jgi:hypothetical protein